MSIPPITATTASPRFGLTRTRRPRPPHPILVIRPDGALWCRTRDVRGQPGPRGQLRRTLEPADIADLGDKHRRQDRPDPGARLDRQVARVLAPGRRRAW